jgi:hypothetical protein
MDDIYDDIGCHNCDREWECGSKKLYETCGDDYIHWQPEEQV